MFQKKKYNVAEKTEKSIYDRRESSTTRSNCIIRKYTGLLLLAFSAILATLSNVFVKQLTYISPGQLSMVRFTGAWTGALPIAVYLGRDAIPIKKKEVLLLGARGLISAAGLYLNLTAYRYLPISQAATITSTMPAATTILARVCLKEACSWFQWLAILLSTAGVLLSVRLPALLGQDQSSEITIKDDSAGADGRPLFGVLSAVASVFLYSASIVMLREMRRVHFSLSLAFIGFTGMLGNASINSCSSRFVAARCGWDRYKVLLVGVFGFLGFSAATVAVQLESASVAAVVGTSLSIALSMVFDALLFGRVFDACSAGGAFLVMLSVSLIGLSKWIASLPEESDLRGKLRCVLL